MATPSYRFTTTTTGDQNLKPVAVLATNKIDTVIGSIIQLDGRQSYDPEKQPITFKWRFTQIPLGSEVEAAGFKDLRPNSTAVSFIPDKTGVYVVELVVNDGELDSDPATVTVNIQLSRVPCGENIIPDAKFLWSYISDFWNLVEDRDKIASIWSSVIQSIGSELIQLWSNDYNKSFNTIQSTYQRRWLKFSMVTDLTEVYSQRIIVGKTDSGVGGSSGVLGSVPGTGFTSSFYVPRGSVGDGDRTDFTNLNGNYGAKGRVIVVDGYTYTIDSVSNKDLTIASGVDLVTTLSSTTVSSSSGFGTVKVGDSLSIRSGANAGLYKVKQVFSSTSIQVVYPNDPPGGPVPSFAAATGQSFSILRAYSLATMASASIPDGLVNSSWRVPHLLHTPNVDLEAAGVRPGDIVTFEVTRADLNLSTEVQAQVVGASRDRLGFEFTMQPLDVLVNSGSGASIVESGGVVTVSGLQNMKATSVGGYLEVLNGDNPGTYRIRQYVSEDAVIIDNPLASGADSGNPDIQWQERARTGTNVDRALFQQIVRDLKIVPPTSGDAEVDAAAGALISFMPVAINLVTRPFSKFGITFKAKKVLHNQIIRVPNELVGVPALQESVVDPPVVLRENLDYLIESGYLSFINGLFTLSSPAPEQLWGECAFFNNESVVERNFGRLVDLSKDVLTQKRTRAPYLSAVKGLFYAYTNGPAIANIRLGLQILLGLPFSEARGVVLEVQDSFTVDTNGSPLGRILIEDLDDENRKTGYRRLYLYPVSVGLEINPATMVIYKVGDTVERFAPLSKGVEVLDYVKDPLWWKRSLQGLEVLKYFTFKAFIDTDIFDSNDVQFALEFIKSIRPSYTKVIATALMELSDDIFVTDAVGGSALMKFYDSTWGLQAANRANEVSSQGAVLWNVSSYPFSLRTPKLLRDVETRKVGSAIHALSATGWDMDTIRARTYDTSTCPGLDEGRLPPIEGDILVIQSGLPGVPDASYEIEEVIDANTLKLGWVACSSDPDSYVVSETVKTPLDPDLFTYGYNQIACIVRRDGPTVLWGLDLETDGSNIVQSATANFLKNPVRVGDLLSIEYGVNKGEYLIDAFENSGSSASVSGPVGGIATVTGLSSMTLSSEGGLLEFLSGLNQGVYRITEFVSSSSVKIQHPGALIELSIPWRELPAPPFIENDRLLLKNSDGTTPALTVGTAQKFRVLRPFFNRAEVYRVRYRYETSPSEYLLEAAYVSALGIGRAADWRDIFTPGMVGLPVNVSESGYPVNDGEFIITKYFNSGRVGINSSSTTSESSPGQSKLNFLRSP